MLNYRLFLLSVVSTSELHQCSTVLNRPGSCVEGSTPTKGFNWWKSDGLVSGSDNSNMNHLDYERSHKRNNDNQIILKIFIVNFLWLRLLPVCLRKIRDPQFSWESEPQTKMRRKCMCVRFPANSDR